MALSASIQSQGHDAAGDTKQAGSDNQRNADQASAAQQVSTPAVTAFQQDSSPAAVSASPTQPAGLPIQPPSLPNAQNPSSNTAVDSAVANEARQNETTGEIAQGDVSQPVNLQLPNGHATGQLQIFDTLAD